METIYALVAKTEKLNYVMVLALWVIGGALTLVGFPWIILGILEFAELGYDIVRQMYRCMANE